MKVRDRGKLEVESLLQAVLAILVAWIALEILHTVIGITLAMFRFLRPLIVFVVVVLVALWVVDRI